MKKIILTIILIVMITGTACQLPIHYVEYMPSKTVDETRIKTPVAGFAHLKSGNPTPTVTPIPTETLTPEPTPTHKPKKPTKTPTPETFFPGGTNRIPQVEGQVNILLLGSDERPDGAFRTDVIILLNLNPQTGKASIVSFPRDLYLPLPDYGYQRINTSQEFGGFALTTKTFEFNFGVHPDYYVMVNFNGFRNIIDILGGIDVNSAQPLNDRCDIPGNPNKYCAIDAGINHFNGDMALWYARSRYSTSDADRMRRCQEVIIGIYNAMMSRDAINHGAELFQEMQNSVETNLNLDGVISLLPMASLITQPGNFRQFIIGPDQTTVWIPPSGAYLLLPNLDAIHTFLVNALSN
jgi:polyisoprenyl-teichoic acid--peptidoglycan teichoic acid transferase